MSDFHEPVNIGNPREMTIKQFAEEIIRITGTKSQIEYKPLPVDDPKVRQPDIGRARKVLGWEPRVDFEEGIVQTIEYFRGCLDRGELGERLQMWRSFRDGLHHQQFAEKSFELRDRGDFGVGEHPYEANCLNGRFFFPPPPILRYRTFRPQRQPPPPANQPSLGLSDDVVLPGISPQIWQRRKQGKEPLKQSGGYRD